MMTEDRDDAQAKNPGQAEQLTQLLSAAAERMPESDWQRVAAEVVYLLRTYPLETEQPALYRLVQDSVPMEGVEAGRHLARVISRAASAMRPAARMALWQELWRLLKDEQSVPAELAAAINTLPDDEEWL